MNPRIVAAQAAANEARQSLIDTAHELQQRLQPKTLARDAWAGAKVKGADLAEGAVDAVRRRPVATGGVLAAIAMFLAREPIKDGVRRLYDAVTSADDESAPRSRRKAPVHELGTARPTIRAPRPVRKLETK